MFGWECPRCSRCYSGAVTECMHCADLARARETITTTSPYEIEQTTARTPRMWVSSGVPYINVIWRDAGFVAEV